MALSRAAGFPLSFWGAALAHLGVGVTLLGLAGVGFGAEAITTLHKGVPQTVGPYQITLDSVGERVGPNYKETVATMTVRSGDAVVTTIEPARRQFAARTMTTTQSGMATLHFGQIYVSIADPTPDGAVPARLYWKPLVTLIWLGGCAMALGGGAVARRPAAALRRRPKVARGAAPRRRSRRMPRLAQFAIGWTRRRSLLPACGEKVRMRGGASVRGGQSPGPSPVPSPRERHGCPRKVSGLIPNVAAHAPQDRGNR